MDSLDRTEITKNITLHGCHIIGVGDGPHPFAYTIGLTAKYGFELLMVGLRADYAATIMNDAVQFCPPKLGMPYDKLGNLPLIFKACTRDLGTLHAEYVCQADAFYGRNVSVLQLVMPDRAGLFPDNPAFDHEYMDQRQRLFCRF